MANLSNINNILRTGSLGVGINRDPLGAFEISSATKPGIKMFNTAASGKTYEAYSDTNGNYIIYDQDADDNRFVINSAGNATFAGAVTIPGAISAGTNGGLRIHSSGTKFFNVTAANAARNNIMDIGAPDAKFKDLYLGGSITVGRGFFNSGATNVVATFTSTDGTATLQCADPTGNVEFGASGNNFVVQPAGGVAQLTVGSSSSTFAGMILLDGVNQIRFLPQAGESYNEAMRIIRSSDELGFHYGENANEEAFIIDKDGNSRVYHKLGIRVDGDAIPWRGTAQIPAVINLAGNGAVFTRPDNTFLSQNFYYNVSDIGAVIDPGKGSIIQLTTGDIIFSGTTTGASGGDQISIQERMRIDGNGQMTYQGAEPGTTGIRFQGSGTCNGYAGSLLNYYTMDVMRDQGSGKAINSQGTISIADGYGIEFGASQGAGATSTLLDDYEEGTFTVRLQGSGGQATHSIQAGFYTKVGNVVTCVGTYTWNSSGSNANTTTKLEGFPFVNSSTSNTRAAGSLGAVNGIAQGATLRLVIDPGHAGPYIIQQNSNNYSHNNSIAASGAIYGFSITYRTN